MKNQNANAANARFSDRERADLSRRSTRAQSAPADRAGEKMKLSVRLWNSCVEIIGQMSPSEFAEFGRALNATRWQSQRDVCRILGVRYWGEESH